MGDLSQFKEVPEGYEPKDGDEVALKVKIVRVSMGNKFITAKDIQGNLFEFKVNDIIAIRERPIEVGCRVDRPNSPKRIGVVLCLDEDEAWVKWEPNEYFPLSERESIDVAHLERVS